MHIILHIISYIYYLFIERHNIVYANILVPFSQVLGDEGKVVQRSNYLLSTNFKNYDASPVVWYLTMPLAVYVKAELGHIYWGHNSYLTGWS